MKILSCPQRGEFLVWVEKKIKNKKNGRLLQVPQTGRRWKWYYIFSISRKSDFLNSFAIFFNFFKDEIYNLWPPCLFSLKHSLADFHRHQEDHEWKQQTNVYLLGWLQRMCAVRTYVNVCENRTIQVILKNFLCLIYILW